MPAATLTLLQAKFDEFLRAELDECETLTPGEICLPPLPALTELELPEMWFPLAPFQKVGVIFRVFCIDCNEKLIGYGRHFYFVSMGGSWWYSALDVDNHRQGRSFVSLPPGGLRFRTPLSRDYRMNEDKGVVQIQEMGELIIRTE